jgi:hypothetical protein
MINADHISESFETIFWVKILIFFDADPRFGMEKRRIRDKHPGSATLFVSITVCYGYIVFTCFFPLINTVIVIHLGFSRKDALIASGTLKSENKTKKGNNVGSFYYDLLYVVGCCAAKAFYSCPAIISQRLESRIISREPLENTEEESKII